MLRRGGAATGVTPPGRRDRSLLGVKRPRSALGKSKALGRRCQSSPRRSDVVTGRATTCCDSRSDLANRGPRQTPCPSPRRTQVEWSPAATRKRDRPRRSGWDPLLRHRQLQASSPWRPAERQAGSELRPVARPRQYGEQSRTRRRRQGPGRGRNESHARHSSVRGYPATGLRSFENLTFRTGRPGPRHVRINKQRGIADERLERAVGSVSGCPGAGAALPRWAREPPACVGMPRQDLGGSGDRPEPERASAPTRRTGRRYMLPGMPVGAYESAQAADFRPVTRE